MPKITEMYAFVVDELSGDQAIPAMMDAQSGHWYPLIGADMKRIDSLRMMAIALARRRGLRLHLMKFKLDSNEVIET